MNERSLQHSDQGTSNATLARHSVRAHPPTVLDNATVQTLLDAAVNAPTAMHACALVRAVS